MFCINRETDIRAPPGDAGVLVHLLAVTGTSTQAKCLAINPVMPEYMAVGGNDPFVRMYDRRNLKPHIIEVSPLFSKIDIVNGLLPFTLQFPEYNGHLESRRLETRRSAAMKYNWAPLLDKQNACYFIPGHLPKMRRKIAMTGKQYAATHVTFSSDGRELMANLGGEQIYLFDAFHYKPLLSESIPFQSYVQNCDSPSKEKGTVSHFFVPVAEYINSYYFRRNKQSFA